MGRVSPLEEHWSSVAAALWQSAGGSEAPARLALPIRAVGAPKLRVLFEDGDNAPLSTVTVVLWRRAHTLVFPWPGEGAIELLAGSPELSPPRYDLAAAGRDLILDAEVTAMVRGVAPGGKSAESPVVRWALLIALAVAAIVLVAILGRALRGQPGNPAPGT